MARSRRHRNPRRRRSSGIPFGKIAMLAALGGAAYALYAAGGSIGDALSGLNPLPYLTSAVTSAEDAAGSALTYVESGISAGVTSVENGISSGVSSAEAEATSLWTSFTSMF
jgi:hypothetical protein